MDANLLTFSGSAAVALFAAFLSWGRGLKSCVVAVVATVALVLLPALAVRAACRASGLESTVRGTS